MSNVWLKFSSGNFKSSRPPQPFVMKNFQCTEKLKGLYKEHPHETTTEILQLLTTNWYIFPALHSVSSQAICRYHYTSLNTMLAYH